jgi:hypothetical protein
MKILLAEQYAHATEQNFILNIKRKKYIFVQKLGASTSISGGP